MSFCKILLLVVFLALSPIAALAQEWTKSESEHFVLYSNTGPGLSRTYLINLERFHNLLTIFHATNDGQQVYPKLDVYFLSAFKDLQETWPQVNENVAGYFTSSDIGIVAFSISQHDGMRSRTSGLNRSKRDGTLDENQSQTVLFHEYSHYFQHQNDSVRYPRWFVEGFA